MPRVSMVCALLQSFLAWSRGNAVIPKNRHDKDTRNRAPHSYRNLMAGGAVVVLVVAAPGSTVINAAATHPATKIPESWARCCDSCHLASWSSPRYSSNPEGQMSWAPLPKTIKPHTFWPSKQIFPLLPLKDFIHRSMNFIPEEMMLVRKCRVFPLEFDYD